ncbi:unnamed protein product [Microthlaspi erraticum]|uniref:Uncharacterized protein n=1 Tax=Microthlaspi erraticum TaxID=1685480 RepID=A0A6D2KEE2_9BRAS|nr:unnamed protein product [Microthlaspi erraticum]
MGCCFSAGKVTAPPVSAADAEARIPPPIEEESVKEVVVQSVSVSVPIPVPTTVSVPDIVPSAPEVSDSETQPPPSLPTPEISHDKSDICSVSNSFSTATTATAASILEDDALSKPHRPPPPSSSSSRRSRPERISRSPGGRNSPQGKLRPRLVRERPTNPPNPTLNRRNVDSGPLPRSGLQEGPRRRSRSPATRAPSSARRSPMKKREAAPEKDVAEVIQKKEETKVAVEVKKEEDVAVRDPEVSMECFIFL